MLLARLIFLFILHEKYFQSLGLNPVYSNKSRLKAVPKTARLIDHSKASQMIVKKLCQFKSF